MLVGIKSAFAVVLLYAGCLCKKTLGTGGGGLVHTVWNELGPDATRYCINNTQFTVNYWLLHVSVNSLYAGPCLFTW